MIRNDACCQTIEGHCPSPFEISTLGWHDGLTSGMARCRECARCYHVEMVAWDHEQEVRVYGFREISRASYDTFMAVQASGVPSPQQAIDRSDELALRERDALATGFERTLYVAAVDLMKEILGSRRVPFSLWASLLDMK
jgi:hypothetical protein